MKRIIFVFVVGFGLSALCFAQIAPVSMARTGEINRGIFYQEGIASWYGGEFNGRPTASGEIFNDSQLTAAHPILPFGTMLKVTNQHNNKAVIVRVNDRGPFVAERIIDISRSAAELLDMTSTGTAPVKVESLQEVSLPAKPGQTAPVQSTAAAQPAQNSQTIVVQPGQTIQVQAASVEPFSNTESALAPTQFLNQIQQPAVSMDIADPWLETGSVRFHPPIPGIYTGKNYRVQVGAYKQSEYAIEAYEKLKKAGLNPSYEPYGDYCRVVVAGLKQEELKAVADKLIIAGYREVLLREE